MSKIEDFFISLTGEQALSIIIFEWVICIAFMSSDPVWFRVVIVFISFVSLLSLNNIWSRSSG